MASPSSSVCRANISGTSAASLEDVAARDNPPVSELMTGSLNLASAVPQRICCTAEPTSTFAEPDRAKWSACSAFLPFSEAARGSGLLRRLRHKPGELLSLMRECFHLLARELALNVEGLFEVFCVNETLRKLEVRLEVGFGVLHGLLVDLTGAAREYVGGLCDDVMGLTSSFEEAIVCFASLIDALAGNIAHGSRNFEI